MYRAGQWVQLYADADRDPKYTADAITWLRNFTALAHTVIRTIIAGIWVAFFQDCQQ